MNGEQLCPHDVDLRFSRCISCEERARPRGDDGRSKRSARYGPEGDPVLYGYTAADWKGMAAAAAEGAQADLGKWTNARYSGTCRGCGGRWEPGSLIRFSEDEQAWVCETCGSVR